MLRRTAVLAIGAIGVAILMVALVPLNSPARGPVSNRVHDLAGATGPLGSTPAIPAGSVGGDRGALTWTTGQPYPMVNGKPTPPPIAAKAQAGSPTSYGGHWYAGSVYNGVSTTTSWVFTEVTVPSATSPDSSEFYYVILSVWDNNGSYDQIGFTDDYGTWGLAWSYTSGSCSSPTYSYSPNAVTLTAGQLYLFAITTNTGSSGVYEEAWSVSNTGSLTTVYSSLKSTGASSSGLVQQGFYCGSYDYTDYEEVYGTTSYTQPDPYGAPGGMVWFFHDNLNYSYVGASAGYNFQTFSAWKTSNAPPGTHAVIGKYKTHPELVNVYNFESTAGYITG